jgi:hypothetical protein
MVGKTAVEPGPPLRAYGRSLSDFGKLSSAETTLLECCYRGEMASVSAERPEAETPANCVRADFVRFLGLGGDDRAAVHEHGVVLRGAWLTGVLDLDSSIVPHRILLLDCRIERIHAREARIRFLSLSRSLLIDGLFADGLHCEGAIFLRESFHATGPVRLVRATILGRLECAGGHFENAQGRALSLDEATVSGAVTLNSGFRATGEVSMVGATIGGDLACDGGTFANGDNDALSAHGATISGHMYLNDGFRSTGGVYLISAKIGGALDCGGGCFENGNGNALSCDSAQITRGLMFRDAKIIKGGVDLSACHVGAMSDDMGSWSGAAGRLILDGFTYGRLMNTRVDALTRLAWLSLQRPDDLGDKFKPQPWEQLIAVLRQMGHPDEARRIAIARHKRMREAGRYVGGSKTWDWIYGRLVEYGYNPWKLLWIAVGVWLLCAAAYSLAIRPNWFGSDIPLLGPTHSEASTSCLLAHAAAGNEEPCPSTNANYGNFFAPAYSAEVLLPVISLGSKAEWKPVLTRADGTPHYWGWALFLLYWFEVLFGWLAGLLLVAAVGNLVKKE